MGGVFSKANRPKLPGAYTNFVSLPASSIPAQPGTVVAIPFTSDWGPFEQATRVQSFGEYQAVFGGADDTAGYRAVKQAFLGEDLNGRRGAGEVVCFRMGGATAAKATRTLQNTTPAAALTLTAKYEGSKGNDLKVTTQDLAGDATKDELIVYDGTVELERYIYTDTDIQGLADEINLISGWVAATVTIDSVALAPVTSQALTAGDDGTTLLAADWTDAMEALEVEGFAIFAGYGLTDSSILASVKTWIQGLNITGKRCFAVVGGAAGESVGSAVSRSATLADPNIINVGCGTITDLSLGAGHSQLDLGGAQLCARVAGILAARGEYQSLTAARLAGVKIKIGPTAAEQVTAFDGGVVVFGRDSHSIAPVHIRVGLSTWRKQDSIGDPTKPYLIFRQPKYVRTMHGIEMDLTRFAEESVIGTTSISSATREAVLAEVKRALRERADAGVVQVGWTAGIDQDPPPTPEDEFVAIAISVKFGRSLEQIFFTVTVS